MVPAIFLSMQVTGHMLPQTGMGATLENGKSVLTTLNELSVELGFNKYTDGSKTTIDLFFMTAALMCGTAGLPHVIVRFFTVPRVNVITSYSIHYTKLYELTPQQFRVLTMLTEGLLNKQIAYELNVSEATIKAHVTAILRKLGVHSRTQAVIAAQRLGVEPVKTGV